MIRGRHERPSNHGRAGSRIRQEIRASQPRLPLDRRSRSTSNWAGDRGTWRRPSQGRPGGLRSPGAPGPDSSAEFIGTNPNPESDSTKAVRDHPNSNGHRCSPDGQWAPVRYLPKIRRKFPTRRIRSATRPKQAATHRTRTIFVRNEADQSRAVSFPSEQGDSRARDERCVPFLHCAGSQRVTRPHRFIA